MIGLVALMLSPKGAFIELILLLDSNRFEFVFCDTLLIRFAPILTLYTNDVFLCSAPIFG
jgi:hypothetical protein